MTIFTTWWDGKELSEKNTEHLLGKGLNTVGMMKPVTQMIEDSWA